MEDDESMSWTPSLFAEAPFRGYGRERPGFDVPVTRAPGPSVLARPGSWG